MPFLEVRTQVRLSEEGAQGLLLQVSKTVATALSKPESYMMTSFANPAVMTFRGTAEPCCLLTLRQIGPFPPGSLATLAKQLTTIVFESTGVAEDRVFFVCDEVPREQWGMAGAMLG